MKPSTLFKITNVLDRMTSFLIQPIITTTNVIIMIAGFVILLVFHNIDIAELTQQTTTLPEAAAWILRILRSLGWVMMTNILCRFILMLHTQTKQTTSNYAYATVLDRAYEDRRDDGSIVITGMIHKTETEKHSTTIIYDEDGRVCAVKQSKFSGPNHKEAPHTYRDQVFFQEGHVIAIHTVDELGLFIAERVIQPLNTENTENTTVATDIPSTEHLSNEPSPLPQS